MSSDVCDSQEQSRVRDAAGRFASLLEAAPDPAAHLPRSEWTVRDLAAHVAVSTEVYCEYVGGRTESFFDLSDIAGGSLARTSAERLVEEPELDVLALAKRFRASVERLLAATPGRPREARVLWHGIELDVRSVLGMALGEYLMHGYDLAQLLGRSWPIESEDARAVLASALPLLPLLANPRTTANTHAAFDLRVRGGTQLTLYIDDGIVTTGGPGLRVDCHVSADPVALLFVAYGRRSQWRPIFTGRMVAWGRKPWLALRLTSYLVAP